MLSLVETVKRALMSVSKRTLPLAAESAEALPRVPPAEPDAIGGEANEPVGLLSAWGPLEIRGEISRGTFGVVYRAWDPALRREVALKLYAQGEAAGRDGSKAVSEGCTLAQLKDDNIASVYGAGTHSGQTGIWMELIKGRPFSSIVNECGPMSAREAALVGIDLCNALAKVHAAGLLHRDIKAENLMREERGRVVLIDFGLSEERRDVNARTRGELAGTPLYMAPELFEGKPASVASEVYSAGVLLFHLTSGEYPVAAGSIEELKTVHREGRRASLRDLRPELPEEFVEAVERAISPAPGDRPASAASMVPALRRVLDPSRRTHLATRRTAIGGAVVAFGAAAGYWLMNRERALAQEGATVLLADMVNATGEKEMDGAGLLFRRQLGQTAYLRLMEANRLSEILNRMKADTRNPTPDQLREAARLSGTALVVFPKLSQLGGEYSLGIQLEIPAGGRSGKIQNAFGAPDRPSVWQAVDGACRWIRRMAGEHAGQIARQDRPPEDVTTGSWDALRFFLEGERLARTQRRLDAIPEYREAVLRDPKFALAHMRLADLLVSAQSVREGWREYEETLKLAAENRLTRREQLRIRGLFREDTGNLDDAEQAYQAWALEFPFDDLPWFYRAHILMERGELRQSTAMFERALKIEPAAYTLSQLAWNYAALGDFGRSEESAERLARNGQSDYAFTVRASAAFLQNRFADALNSIRHVRRSESPVMARRAALWETCLWADCGRNDLALAVLESDIEGAHQPESTGQKYGELLAAAWLKDRTGDRNGGLALLRSLADRDLPPQFMGEAGSMFAVFGDTASANRLLGLLERDFGHRSEGQDWPAVAWARAQIRWRIAACEGRADEAAKQLEANDGLLAPIRPRVDLAETRVIAGDRKGAFGLYRKILANEWFLWRDRHQSRPGLLWDALTAVRDLAGAVGGDAERSGSTATERLMALTNFARNGESMKR